MTEWALKEASHALIKPLIGIVRHDKTAARAVRKNEEKPRNQNMLRMVANAGGWLNHPLTSENGESTIESPE